MTRPEIAADPVLLVDDRVAGAHLGEVAQHRVDVRPSRAVAAAAANDARVELGLGDERELRRRPHEAGVHRRRAERDGGVAREELAEIVDVRQAEPVLGEILVHRLAAAGALRADQDPHAARVGKEALERSQRVVGAAIDLNGRERRRDAFDRSRARVRGVPFDPGEGLERSVERVFRHEYLGRWKKRSRLVATQEPVARIGVLPEARHRAADVADAGNDCIPRQVVGERRRRLEEQRQVVFDAPGGDAVAHVAVERRLRGIALEHLAIAAAEARAPGFVQRELARRKQPDVGNRVERALRVDVEGLDALDVVAEEIEPIGERAAHRKQVDEAAADRELARRDDLRDVLIAGERELGPERVDVEGRALLQEERERGEVRRRSEPVKRRRRGHDQNVALAARDAIQRGQALRDEIVMRRERVVRQRLPVGKESDAHARREPRQLLGDALRTLCVGGDGGQHALPGRTFARELRERERVGGARQRRDAGRVPGRRHPRSERGQRGEPREGRGGIRNRRRGGGAARCGGTFVRNRGGRRAGGEGFRRHVQGDSSRDYTWGRVHAEARDDPCVR